MARNIQSANRLNLEPLEAREVPALVYGVTATSRLVAFDTLTPSLIRFDRQLVGLAVGERIVNIDIRPGSGVLYGRSDLDRLYIINPATGFTTGIGGVVPVVAGRMGFDFDPVTDRIRIASNLGENIVINPTFGTQVSVDARLAYRTTDVAAGVTPRVAASANTNSVPFALTTTLYGIDHSRNTLVVIGNPSPATGQLSTVGSLGVDTTAFVGMDITGFNNTAFAAMQVNGQSTSTFYRINLTTGVATLVGSVGGRLISDIAVVGGAFGVAGVSGGAVAPVAFAPATTTTSSGAFSTISLTQPLFTDAVSDSTVFFAPSTTLTTFGAGVPTSPLFLTVASTDPFLFGGTV